MSEMPIAMRNLEAELMSHKVSGLLKIYLLKSFFNNLFVEVNCQGNTNNTGNNGAGKTSLLSLIPIFYGAEPNTVVSREAGKSSFVQYYLPANASLLAFEYLHLGEKRCVLLYSHESQLYYRFVACSGKELFSKENMEAHADFNDTREWLKAFVAKKYPTSIQLNSTIDYRTIIQNGRQRLLKNRQQNIALAREYSLCSSAKEMQHMGALTAIMIRNNRLLEQLRIMLVDCYLGNSMHIEVPIVDAQSLNSQTLRAILEVKKQEPNLRAAIAKRSKLNEDLGKVKACYKYVCRYQDSMQERREVLKRELETFTQNLELLNESFEHKRQHLEQQKSSLDIKAQQLAQAIEALEKKRAEYDELDINNVIARYDNLASYQEGERSAKAHYDSIKASQDKLISDFDSKRLLLNKEHQKHVEDINQVLKSLDEKLKALQGELNDKKNAARLACEQEQEARRQERNTHKQDLNDKILALSSKITELKKPTELESKKLQGFEATIESLEDKLSKKQKDYIAVNKLLGAKDKALVSLKDKLEKTQNRITKLSLHIEDLKSKLNPQSGSLQAFLEEARPLWREDLGKIINPELLKRVDLNPALQSKEQSLYGLSLDYGAIQTPEYLLNIEELKRILEEKLLELKSEDESKERLLADHNKADREYKEQKALQLQLASDLESLQGEITAQKNAFKSYKMEVERESNLRADKSLEDLVALKQQLATFDVKTKSLLSEIKQEHLNHELEIAAIFAQKEEPILAHKQLKEDELSFESNNYKKRNEQLNQACDAALRQEGLDPKIVREARDTYEKAHEEVESIQKTEQLVTEYKAWDSTQWRSFDKLNDDLRQSELQLNNVKHALQQEQEQFNQKSNVIKVKLKELRRADKYAESEYQTLESCLQNVLQAEIDSMSATIEAVEIDYVEVALELNKLASDLVRSAKASRKALENAVISVNNILQASHSDNVIAKSWEELLAHRRESFDESAYYSQEFYLSCVDDLVKLLDEIIPLNELTVIESVRTASQSFMNFYVSLEAFNKRVQSLSREFGKQVALDNPFKSLSDIQIELLSKVEEQDLWTPLRNFADKFTAYQEQGGQGAPSLDFLTTFETLNSVLKNCHISENLESLVSLRISLRENGRQVQIRSDSDLSGLSSRGISKLAIIVIFCGLTRYLCQDQNVRIHWPLDELGELHEDNVVLLFELMNRNNIVLFCAQPNPSPSLLQYFDTSNYIDKNKGVKLCVDANISADNPLLRISQE